MTLHGTTRYPSSPKGPSSSCPPRPQWALCSHHNSPAACDHRHVSDRRGTSRHVGASDPAPGEHTRSPARDHEKARECQGEWVQKNENLRGGERRGGEHAQRRHCRDVPTQRRGTTGQDWPWTSSTSSAGTIHTELLTLAEEMHPTQTLWDHAFPHWHTCVYTCTHTDTDIRACRNLVGRDDRSTALLLSHAWRASA